MRPVYRSECPDTTSEPCPWVGCRYHLLLTTMRTGGGIRIGHAQEVSCKPDDPPSVFRSFEERALEALERMPYTCALDMAEEMPWGLEEIGNLLGCSKERIRQIEEQGLRLLRQAFEEQGYSRLDVVGWLEGMSKSNYDEEGRNRQTLRAGYHDGDQREI